jgi:hypothetical protein
MLLRLMLLGALASSGAGASWAQTQPDYVAQSRLAYAAIRCEKYAEIASINEATGDSGRLFAVGYRALQSVLEARHSDGSVGREADATEPYGIILNMRLGPSPEFDVGRLHHAITDLAWATIDAGVSGGITADNFIQAKAVAQRLYRDANCDFVGR